MDLTLKQQQFNAAMARYNTSKGYLVFGRLVAIANIVLQTGLLYLAAQSSIGWVWQLGALVAAYLIADFVNGLVHWYMDSQDQYESVVGPLIANFHLHHKLPRYQDQSLLWVYFNESGSKVWLVFYLGAVMVGYYADIFPPMLMYILAYVGILSSVAEVSHYLCHNSSSSGVKFLARMGLLLSKRHHAQHHLQDNVNYAFLNGLTDPLINWLARSYGSGYKNGTDQHYARYEVTTRSG